jgi:cyclic-di-AMP phosphodiesterase PgpH
MNKILDNIAFRIPNFAKYLVALATVVALSFLFPTNAKFKYNYSLGQNWLHEDQYAGFDFAIKKSDEELETEKVKLVKEFIPYYEIDLDLIKAKKKQFIETFNERIKLAKGSNQYPDAVRNTQMYSDYGSNLIERLFTRGILKQDTFTSNKSKDRTVVLNIVRGNTNEKQTLQNIYTPENVKDFLKDTLLNSKLRDASILFKDINDLITPNLSYNPELTKKFQQGVTESVTASKGMVKKGDLIVPKGGVINATTFQKLKSYQEQYEADYSSSSKYYLVLLGYFLLVGVSITLYMFYLKYQVPSVFLKLRWIIFLLSWVVAFSYIMYFLKISGVLNIYMVPFCIAPIVIKNFHNRELALVTHLVNILIVGLVVAPGLDFIYIQVLSGLVVVFARWETRYWGHFFQSIFYIILTYWVAFVAMSLIEENNYHNIDWRVLIWLSLNGFLTLLAYPLIPLTGNFFGFTSNITLAELSDLNHPLLKELSMKAPGTLQHSLQVSNLSEAAAVSVNANPLLVKVAALYHDVGKITNPTYFSENQSGKNHHDELSHIDSAKMIISHVSDGVKLAQEFGLPELIIDFIRSHHGTTLVAFFYRNHLKKDPNGYLDEEHFKYQGPKPKSKEETILMLADSLEATAKSIKDIDSVKIDEMVERIVSDKVAHGQLSESVLGFNELEKCKASFKQTIKSIYHVRVEYPK